MTPAEFKKAQTVLGLTDDQLGRILASNPRTIRKWKQDDGTRPVNPIAARVMKWMIEDDFRPPEWPAVDEKR